MAFGYAVYFSDREKNRVVRWDPDAGTTQVVAGEPGDGDPTQKLQDPYGLAFDPAGQLLVADKFNNRVCRLKGGRLEPLSLNDASGHRGRRPNSPPHYDPSQLPAPAGLFAEPGGTLLCTFHHDHTVYRIHPDGRLELVLGVPRSTPYQFCEPRETVPPPEVADTPIFLPTQAVRRSDGTVYFIERGFQLVREFHPARGLKSLFPLASLGDFQGKRKIPPELPLSAYHAPYPGGLALDGSENLYVAEIQHGCVIHVDFAQGKVRRVMESRKSPDEARGGVAALAFGPDGTAWVVDAQASLIEGYEAVPGGPWRALGVSLASVAGSPIKFPFGGLGIVAGP